MSDRGPGRYPCPCCGTAGLQAPNAYEICTVCGWEDDPVQAADERYRGGANTSSLAEAKRLWRQRQSAHLWHQIVWLAICIYLLLCTAGESLYLARWVVEQDSPTRHELLLGASVAALWGAPAVLLVIVLSWLPVFKREFLLSRVARLLAVLVLILWGGAVLAAVL